MNSKKIEKDITNESFESKIKEDKTFDIWMKDENDAVWSGVVSGLSRYTGINVTFLRALTVGIGFFSGFISVFIYFLISWLILPDYNKEKDKRVISARKKRKISSTIISSSLKKDEKDKKTKKKTIEILEL